MRTPASVFTIVLALGAIVLAPRGGAQAQDAREEGPKEIEKCQTIDNPGSYKIVKNLTITGTTGVCLSITADFVTIDLAGFTITGNGMSAIVATPPSNQGLTGITVRNGSISGVFSGVDLSSADSSIVEGLRVFRGVFPNSQRASGVGISASGIVKNNTVAGFAGEPSTSNTGISATGVVTGNFVIDGRPFGFAIGEGSTVIGNTVTGAEIGFSVSCPSNLTNNTAVKNATNLLLNGDGCNNTNNVAP